jgi:2-polyprenyl-3-methyl-5-hydroxy-6-metoxy-1,4-benzoquinol methylase
MSNIRFEREQYFQQEDYLDSETGYPERNTAWFQKYLLPNVLSQVPDSQKKNLLDVGCAYGYFTRLLAPYFHHTFGIDFTKKRIDYAQRYVLENLSFAQMDLLIKMWPSRATDVVFTTAVMPHIPLEYKVFAFDNIASICKPGATMLMYDGKCETGVVDAFSGIMSSEWIQANVKSWNLKSVEHVVNGTHCFVLIRA